MLLGSMEHKAPNHDQHLTLISSDLYLPAEAKHLLEQRRHGIVANRSNGERRSALRSFRAGQLELETSSQGSVGGNRAVYSPAGAGPRRRLSPSLRYRSEICSSPPVRKNLRALLVEP